MVPGLASRSHDYLGNAPRDVGHLGDDDLGGSSTVIFNILCITIVSFLRTLSGI